MKKFLYIIASALCFVMFFALAGCNGGGNDEQSETSVTPEQPELPDKLEEGTTPEKPEQSTGNNILVVYFSAQNHTETIANYIATETGGELFELVPVNPYTTADLNYNNQNSRVYLEYLDESLRDTALVSYTVENWETYDN